LNLRTVSSVICVAFIVLMMPADSTTAGNESSCITCHTDEAALKRLCTVPELGSGEAEG
jgi:hypothetical protein